MSVGQFVSFSTYMMQLTWPIIALGWVINIFQRGTASLIRINEIMQEEPEIVDAPAAKIATSRVRSNSAGSTSAMKENRFCTKLICAFLQEAAWPLLDRPDRARRRSWT